MSLISELKRRNVIKVALLYVIAAWLILQVADVLFEQLGLPGWAFRFVFGVLVICFPLVLLFSWVFEITPEGIRRETQIAPEASITRQTGQRINKAITALLILAIVTVVADRLIPERQMELPVTASEKDVEAGPVADELAMSAAEKSIAVLPFVNMSGDEENEYFSDGLTEELLNALARIEDLKVAGRTSAFAFKGKNLDLREIARQLDVANLLEGSVRKAGNKVRITAQLVKASDGYHLWSDTFDRELDDIFEVQEEIAEMVAGALEAKLLGPRTGALVQTLTDEPEAWEAYLRGRYQFQLAADNEDNRLQAETEFRHALEIDPDFTLAKWGLFRITDFRHRNGVIDYEEGKRAMSELAGEMLAESPELAESHLAVGRAATNDLRLVDGLSAYRQAVALNPGNVDALLALAGANVNIREFQRAFELRMRALDIDPLSVPVLTVTAQSYARFGDCERVEDLRRRILAINANPGRIATALARCQFRNGTGLEEVIDMQKREPIGFLRHTGLAIYYQRIGEEDKAGAELAAMTEEYGDAASFQYGQVYANWGQAEKAVEWLKLAYDTGDPGAIGLWADVWLEPIRDDPGYLELLGRWKLRAGVD